MIMICWSSFEEIYNALTPEMTNEPTRLGNAVAEANRYLWDWENYCEFVPQANELPRQKVS